ncbi:OmpL47-type beta-barrel domain-containing protein [Microbispora rosea]|uniref:OmpL47-type beta-barrel domain-containing protein n=1 Tax=Microbispora rosea TaxID=58117 RepID=UPI0004C3A4E5|nr:chitobiase/beta-hexosaminidase C-terminal domain-containing protein [Microbispora rosea]
MDTVEYALDGGEFQAYTAPVPVNQVGEHTVRSGVDTVEYALDGGEFQAYTAPVPVNQVGEHTVRYRATDKAGNTSDVATTGFTVVAAPPPAETPLTVTASSRCLGTSVYVAVTAVNDGDVPATVALTTPYGTKTVADVAPGKQAYQSFNARATQIGAGEVTVTGTSSIDGEKVTTPYEAAYSAISCG